MGRQAAGSCAEGHGFHYSDHVPLSSCPTASCLPELSLGIVQGYSYSFYISLNLIPPGTWHLGAWYPWRPGSSWNWSYRWLRAVMWVFWKNGVLNHQAISPGKGIFIWKKSKICHFFLKKKKTCSKNKQNIRGGIRN